MSATAKPTIHRGLIGVQFGTSSLSSIDGDAGKLFYRNIPIEQLAQTCSFEEVVFLLLHGSLPTPDELADFSYLFSQQRRLPTSIRRLVEECRIFAPTKALQVCLSALADEALSKLPAFEQAISLIGAIGSIICEHYALQHSKDMLEPDPALDHASDLYRRLTHKIPTVDEQKLINLDFVLHAEHGANASTTATRVAASAGADMCGATTAALATLKGPKHGGAPTAIFNLIDGISDADQARKIVKDRLAARQAVPGFGHRVYKVLDPRAVLYRDAIERWMDSTNSTKPATLTLVDAMAEAMAIYQRMKIWPNDDLLAVVLYSVLALPKELCVPLFAASRTAGWVAHYIEAKDSTLPEPLLYYETP